MELDVTNSSSVENAIKKTIKELGSIDVLINNAGITISKPALDQTERDWDDVINTNLKGAWLVSQETAKHMKENKKGSIINIASILGIGISGLVPAYCK